MKGLLIKDFRLLAQHKLYLFIILAIVFVMSSGGSNRNFMIGYLMMFGAIFANSTFNYDELDNSVPFLMTLPVTRKEYVWEKYLLNIMITFTCWFLAVAWSAACKVVNTASTTEDLLEFAAEVLLFLAIAFFFTALLLPFVFRFGYQKGMLALFACITVLVCVVIYLATHQFPGLDVFDWLNRLTPTDVITGVSILFVGSVIALPLSFCISLHLYDASAKTA